MWGTMENGGKDQGNHVGVRSKKWKCLLVEEITVVKGGEEGGTFMGEDSGE